MLGEESIGRAANTVILDANGVRNLRIETVEAEAHRFETTLFAIGRIEAIPSNRSVLSSRIAGRVVELNAFEGDVVEAGDVLARVESRQMGNPPPVIDLKASQSGLVVDSHVRLGQPVEPNAELMDISDRSQMWAVARIPEQEAAMVEVGSIAYIRIPALGEELIRATLMRFGVDADRDAGTIEGIFQLENKSGRLRPGLRAEFSIVLEERLNVLAIPREAIQGDPARRIVFVKDFDLENAFVRVPVVLGETNDFVVEILSGIFPGDEVVTRGSYALGFVGGGNGVSLKEALDAAHGHEHNEDGSEITEGQKKARAMEEGHEHHEEDGDEGMNRGLLVYAGVVSVLLLFTAQSLWRKRKQAQG